jgi:hypothetical protein
LLWQGQLFWLPASEIQGGRLKTKAKRKMMTPDFVDDYNAVMEDLLEPRGPYRLIDIHGLTQGMWENIDGN